MEIHTEKRLYNNYINQQENIPIFNKSFWLDAVCGEECWQAILVVENNEVIAAMPCFSKTKYIFNIVTMPKHTQRFSPSISYPRNVRTHHQKVEFENRVMMALLSAFPKRAYFQCSFHFDYENILPFLWSGYNVNYCHTYVIDDISSPEKVFDNFSNNRKRSIKKARKFVVVEDNMKIEEFYSFHKETLDQKKSTISYSLEHLKRVYRACEKNKCGKIFSAVDGDMNLHGALFVVWDRKAAYHLIPIVNPYFYKSQAISLLVFSAIEFLKDKTSAYDFEGSMTINIEKAYREYGAMPKTFFNISKTNSKLIKLFHCLGL